MKKINVIDLDNTLIPFDSFRYFVLEKIKSGNLTVFFYTFLRKLNLMSAGLYKYRIIHATKLEINKEALSNITNNILESLNNEKMYIIQENTDTNTENILCSASPDAYVKKVAEALGWEGYGSGDYENKFYHMYGQNKLKFLKTKFPQSEYAYNFAMSDSETDLELLKYFRKWHIVK